MKLKGVYSIMKTKGRKFGAFKIKFLKLWKHSPVSIVYEDMPPDTKVPSISHQKTDEFVYILKGKAAVCLDGKECLIKKGDYLLIPRGVGHSFRTNSAKMEALSVFSPPMSLTKPDAKVMLNK